jgi:replicative DNA helicase
MTKDRMPKEALESEQGLLGAIIYQGTLGQAKVLGLKPEHFYNQERHARIYQVILDLYAQEKTWDAILLTQELKERRLLEAVGGSSYLGELIDAGPSPALIPAYIDVIVRAAQKRDLRRILEGGLQEEDEEKILASIREYEQRRLLSPTLGAIEYFNSAKVLEEGKAYAKGGKATGYADLDEVVKIFPEELVIIGARARHGKSSFAYNLLLNLLELDKGESFVFFNLDSPTPTLVSRMMSIMIARAGGGSIPYKYILENWGLEGFGKDRNILDAWNALHVFGKEKRLAIVCQPRYTVEQISSHVERMAQERPLGAVIIDYIELIKTAAKADTEELRLAHIVNTLRVEAQRLHVPFIVLAQMNRASASSRKAEDRWPTLEGLRYSGRQEQEATTVLGLFNIEAERIDIEEGKAYRPKKTTELTVITLKNRGGETNAVIPLTFDMVSGNISTKDQGSFPSQG